jgi:hypothetical protein
MISPIFSQLVMLSFPKGFKTVFEHTNGKQYTREAVLEGETVDQWTQMITVTGAKGLAANRNLTAQSFVERIASGFKGACPDTYSAEAVGAMKFSGRDAFVILAGCGSIGWAARNTVNCPAHLHKGLHRLLYDSVGRTWTRIRPAGGIR